MDSDVACNAPVFSSDDNIDAFPDLPAYPVGALLSFVVSRNRVEQLLKRTHPIKVLVVTMLAIIKFLSTVPLHLVMLVVLSLVFFRNP